MDRDDSTGDDSAVWDVNADAEQATFECTRCGWSERRETSPGTCPECDHDLRNTSMPIE